MSTADPAATSIAALAVRGIRLLAPLVLCASLAACGAGDGQASEERIARERQEAALIAAQEERIKALEKERDGDGSVEAEPPTAPRADQAAEDAAPSASDDPPAGGDDWPGGSAYTTILASVGSEAEARRIQTQASGRGLDAGILLSSSYQSLRPGYWVVFSGTSSDKSDADRRSTRAKSLGYASAYPRFVSE